MSRSDLDERLRSLKEDLPDDGFEASLHNKLVAAGPPPPVSLLDRFRDFARARPLFVGAATGVGVAAASFAVLVLLWKPPVPIDGPEPAPAIAAVSPPVTPPAPAAQHTVPVEKIALIKLNFSSEVAIADVEMTLSIDEGLAFWSEGELLPERSFSWVATLEAGDNPIPVIVRGQRPGRYALVATAIVDGERIEHRVELEVTGV